MSCEIEMQPWLLDKQPITHTASSLSTATVASTNNTTHLLVKKELCVLCVLMSTNGYASLRACGCECLHLGAISVYIPETTLVRHIILKSITNEKTASS